MPDYDRNRKKSRRSVEVVSQSTGFKKRSFRSYQLDDLMDESEDACSIDSYKEKGGRRSLFGFGRSDNRLQDTAPRDFELENDNQLQHFSANEQKRNKGNIETEQPLIHEQLRYTAGNSDGRYFCPFPNESKTPPFDYYSDTSNSIPPSPISDSSMPLTQTDTYERDLVGDLVIYLLNHGNNVRLDLMESSKEPLFEDIRDFSCNNKVVDFVNDYNNVFMITESKSDFDDVKIIFFVSHCVTLRMCEKHCHRAGSCTRSCGMLHVCKFYVVGSCVDYRCNFGHDFYDRHNLNVLKGTYAHRMNPTEITEVLLSQRDVVSLPGICTYYNAKGCSKKTCHFLHICKHFVIGNCKFNPCKRSHSLTDYQPSAILRTFCLGHFLETEEDERILLDKLAKVLENGCADNKKESTFRGTFGSATDVRERSAFFLLDRTSDGNWEWESRPSNERSFRPVDHFDEAEIEIKYQSYIQSKEQTVRINGEEIRINFEKMEGVHSDPRKCLIYFKRSQRQDMESPALKKSKKE